MEPEVARLRRELEQAQTALSEAQDRIRKLEAVAETLRAHRNCWFADQEQAMEAAGYPT